MTAIKERIIGAITIMTDQDAEKIWNLIQTNFKLEHLESVPPTDDDLYALQEYHNGNPEYTVSFSTDDVMRELGL